MLKGVLDSARSLTAARYGRGALRDDAVPGYDPLRFHEPASRGGPAHERPGTSWICSKENPNFEEKLDELHGDLEEETGIDVEEGLF